MAVSLKKLENEEVPIEHRREGIDVAFQITAHSGETFYLDSEEQAAELEASLHLKDQRSGGNN